MHAAPGNVGHAQLGPLLLHRRPPDPDPDAQCRCCVGVCQRLRFLHLVRRSSLERRRHWSYLAALAQSLALPQRSRVLRLGPCVVWVGYYPVEGVQEQMHSCQAHHVKAADPDYDSSAAGESLLPLLLFLPLLLLLRMPLPLPLPLLLLLPLLLPLVLVLVPVPVQLLALQWPPGLT